MPRLRLLDPASVAATLTRSRSAARRRANHNLHPDLTDPVQRFLNVLQPGTYVRPHRHDVSRFELFLLLGGKAAMLAFDDEGNVIDSALLAREAALGAEAPGGAWHTVVALEPDTLLFEIKPGPYAPISDKDFAAWAPPEGDPRAAELLERWRNLFA